MSDQPKQPDFDEVLRVEIDEIDHRRNKNKRRPIKPEAKASADTKDVFNGGVAGLALSGGGIRSAAFCLGVLQALGDRLKNVDYLSTVSGGGYIGSALTAATSKSGTFPFGREPDGREAAGVRHIRDYSNYLFPTGLSSFLPNFVICLRGIAANVLLILPVLLACAVVNITTNWSAENLGRPNLGGWEPPLLVHAAAFGITLNLLIVFAILMSCWAVVRSLTLARYPSEVGRGQSTWLVRTAVIFLLAVAAFAIMELQPWLLKAMFDRHGHPVGPSGINLSRLGDTLKLLATILGPLATIIGLLSRPLAAAAKQGTARPGWVSMFSKAAVTLAIYTAGLAIPFLLWVALLVFSYWGICLPNSNPCKTPAPEWLNHIDMLFGGPGGLWKFYLVIIFVTLGAGWFLDPNANSLHRLYRDRLSKAFLFDPSDREAPQILPESLHKLWQAFRHAFVGEETEHGRESPNDLLWLDETKLSRINCHATPYHLLNVALNIEGSKYANRRGRNADFFIFSPRYVGGQATGYVATEAMEKKVDDLDLATAMAISGAAAAANMGVNTIKPLTMTLAILNIRVGYWLPNPRAVFAHSALFRAHQRLWRKFMTFLHKFYFLMELFGWLDEDSDIVYLTDGGHLENLGVFELLRRRCRLIIAVDAEADPAMTFGSFMALQRMARIDLGVEIDLPWAPIRESTGKAGAAVAATGGQLLAENVAAGPHCAVGTITYPEGGEGILLYVKSSLTGDESDDVIDYKRRYDAFPQETTLDQLFSEEQFEVYRDLGRHVMDGVLSGRDEISIRTDGAQGRDKPRWSETSTEPLITDAYKILCKGERPGDEPERAPVVPDSGDPAHTEAQVLTGAQDG